MLLEFSITNYLSFKDKVTFSMEASNSIKGLEKNYINVLDKNILRSASIYGANASGKSNLFKALISIASMIKKCINLNINSPLPMHPFILADSDSLSEFEIKFIKDDIRYVYGFSANSKKIVDEYLYYYPNGREAKIFDRTNTTNITFPQGKTKIQSDLEKLTADNKFFLSVATNLNYALTKPAFDFITEDLNIFFDIRSLINVSLGFYNDDKEGKLKKFALDFLKEADFNIVDFNVDKIEIPEDLLNRELKDKKLYVASFIHDSKDNQYKLDILDESLGTQVIFALIPFISQALKNRKILVIDELDKSLHPFLVQYIVEMFNNPDINVNGAQLIFNTHDTNLLDLNIFRRDQIWFTEKNYETGVSDLYPLDSFSVRNNENVEKGYMNGRYGAVPFINNDINLWEE